MRRRIVPALRAAAFAAVVAVVLGACGGGRDTPEIAYETLRAAVATRDPHLYYEIHQNEIRALARQSAAEWRARIERGEAPRDVLAEAGGVTEPELRQGTLEDAAGWVLVHHSPVTARSRWYEGAVIVKTAPDGADAVCLRLRGTDGTESDLWMLKELEGWALDTQRTWLRK